MPPAPTSVGAELLPGCTLPPLCLPLPPPLPGLFAPPARPFDSDGKSTGCGAALPRPRDWLPPVNTA